MIWTLTGIAVSAVFGITGLYLTMRSRYPGRITFVAEQMIELFDLVGNSLDKLAVTYDGNNIDENLVLLNAAFINSGRTDISPSMVEKPITIKLPDGYKWLSAKLVKSAIKATLNVVDEKTISIDMGLFRCNEYVRFNALAQVPRDDKSDISISKRLRSALKFEHRITNTKRIVETDVKSKITSKKELRKKGLPFVIMLIMTIVLAFYVLFYEGIPKILVFPYKNDKNVIEYVGVRTNSHDDSVNIKSIESEYASKLSFDDFLNGVNGKPRLTKDNSKGIIFFYVIIISQVLIVLVALGMQIYEYVRNRRILKIFGEI